MTPYVKLKMLVATLTWAIGVGKTSVLAELQQLVLSDSSLERFTWVFYLEPVEEWQAEGWLADFNAEPGRTALGFQMKVLLGQDEAMASWLDTDRSSDRPVIVITERSPVDGCQIFMPLSPTTKREKDLVNQFGGRLWKPNVNILLNCSTDTATERRNMRSRDEPSHAYANLVHKQYNENLHLFDSIVENSASPREAAAEILTLVLQHACKKHPARHEL